MASAASARVTAAIAAGAPLEAIGFQGHFSASPTGIPRVKEVLDEFWTPFSDDLQKANAEMESPRQFTDEQRKTLQDLARTVVAHLRLHEARAEVERRENLLRETQAQAEELQAQQEELRVANEELAAQSAQLRESQARLETQQSELEQTNVQLEEHTQRLRQVRGQRVGVDVHQPAITRCAHTRNNRHVAARQ